MDGPLLHQLADRLKALSHPARLKVLVTLAGGDGCQCGAIVAGLPLAQSTVSQHIKVLLEAGLIRGGTEKGRACYCLDAEALATLRRDLDILFSALHAPAPDAACEPEKAHV
ncbi:ArsR/SmtB family transcription factor [Aquabacter cavernae]|uniref:ArsR/SmtB family transcription factor n=1 Tax=Aquabacter cavernae TaxID=2496029 RepID=UPI000F8E63F3|nr:metalloregulator ArsR/SmtB family transcription factor [Aquabacter cavernae]